jgi:hypothetical protein
MTECHSTNSYALQSCQQSSLAPERFRAVLDAATQRERSCSG